MNTPTARQLAACALALCIAADGAGLARAEEKVQPGSEPRPGTAKPQGTQGPVPQQRPPAPAAPHADAPSPDEESTGRLQGCPDPGSRLELIV